MFGIGDDLLLRKCQTIFYTSDTIKHSALICCTDKSYRVCL